jgi:hypothetical protein
MMRFSLLYIQLPWKTGYRSWEVAVGSFCRYFRAGCHVLRFGRSGLSDDPLCQRGAEYFIHVCGWERRWPA